MQEIKTNPTVRHTTPLQLLAAFAATVAVLFVLLLGACALPAQPVLEHVYDSAQTIQQEGLYPEYFGFKLFQMDNYTDTIMLFEAAAMGEQDPLTAMMTATAYNVDNFETLAGDLAVYCERTIPLALLMAVSIVAVFYVGLAWVALGTVPIAELKLHADTAMAQVAHPLFGPAGVVILALTAMVSTSSAINAQLFSQLQMGARMARCGQLPASLQEGERPYNRMLVGGIVVATIIMAAFFNLGAIAQAASATYLITYVAVQIAHWRLRRQTNGSLWLIIAGLLLMLVVLAAFGLEIWQTTPSVFITIAVMLAGGWLVAWLIRPRTAASSGPG